MARTKPTKKELELMEEFNGELTRNEILPYLEEEKIIFASNAILSNTYPNAIKKIRKEFEISKDQAQNLIAQAKEEQSLANAYRGDIEEQINELCNRFEYNHQLAIERGDMKAANTALAEIGKLRQLYIHKYEVEISTKEFVLEWGTANIPTDVDYEEVDDNNNEDEDVPF